MKIPSSVKIGGITYQVKIQNSWFESDESDGETFWTQEQGNTIYIREDLSQEAKEVTFLHECLHAINGVMDHEFLDSLSEQFYQLLKDNNLLK